MKRPSLPRLPLAREEEGKQMPSYPKWLRILPEMGIDHAITAIRY